MMNIAKLPSPNHSKGRNGHKPIMIVSHITEGNYNGAVSWLRNPQSQASSHFVVSKTGHITQLVDIKDTSWCNGTTVRPNDNRYYGLSTLPLVRQKKTNANYYTVTIEHEGFFGQGGGKLTNAQFKATVELHKHIISEVKRIYGVDIPIDRNHIVGHYQINPRTKPNCPGHNFPFDELIKELKKDDIKLIINNKPTDMELKLESGRTYVKLKTDIGSAWVQVKELANLIGADLKWDPKTNTATMNVR